MNVTKTEWPDDVIDTLEKNGKQACTVTAQDLTPACPEIGMVIGWGNPRKPWKPYLAISVWHWHIQIGWLW